MSKSGVFIAIMLLFSSAYAEEVDTGVISKETPWQGSVDFGGTYLQGNSDLLSFFGGLNAKRCFGESSLIFDIDGAYGRSDGIKDKEWISAKTQYNFDLPDMRFYGGFNTDFRNDDIADLNYRISVNPLLGMYLFRSERAKLTLESGPSYVWQMQGGVGDHFQALRFAEEFEYRLSSKSKFWQSVEYSPEVDDFANYQLVTEAGIRTWVSSAASIKAFVQDRYDSEPEGGRENSDMGVYFALSYGLKAPKDYDMKESRKALKKRAKEDWHFVGTLSASRLSGNKDSNGLSSSIDGMRCSNGTETGLGIFGSYADTNGTITAEQAGGYTFYNYDLKKDRSYFGSRLDYLHNPVADLEYRFSFGPHVGYRLIDGCDTRLRIETGPGATFESQGGIRGSYANIRMGEYLDHHFAPCVKLFQSFEYTGSPDEIEDYQLVSKAGFETKFGENWSWQNSVAHNYDNLPAAGLKQGDLSVNSGLKFSF
ncbi:MAG: DUF481 domain-containing protein [Verrucomicrobiales bacterium]|nr:DUF481 domain-containing protein [Verrucomicrobiales bacterium]